MKKVKIKGLNDSQVDIILTFMSSKITYAKYIDAIELYGTGDECHMRWMVGVVDISDDDMLHELFNIYGEHTQEDGLDVFTLKIDKYIFTTSKCGEDWSDEYYAMKEQDLENKDKALHIDGVRERLISALDKVCEKRGSRFGENIFIGHLGSSYDFELLQIDTNDLIDAIIEEYENAL